MFVYIGVCAFYLLVASLTAFSSSDTYGANCMSNNQSWHYVSLSIVNTIQTALLIVLTLVFRMRVAEAQSKKKTLMEDESERRLYWQSLIISAYSVLSTLGGWIELVVGNSALTNGGLECIHEKFILVRSEQGAAWLLYLAIFNVV